ncbi:MAG: fibronectin type III domain-containing protein [bacterium]
MYSDLYLRPPASDRQVPPYLVAVTAVLIVGIFARQMFVRTDRPTEASSMKLVEREQVHTDTTATIYFALPEAHKAYVLYGESAGKLSQMAFDVRTTSGEKSERTYHVIELVGLKPLTQYYYSIVVDDKLVPADKPGSFTTLVKRQSGNLSKPIYGKVIDAQGTPVVGATVTLSTVPKVEGRFATTFTKSTGEWLISMPWATTPEDTLRIRIDTEDRVSSTIQSVLSRSAPLPQAIVLGTDYSFVTESQNVLPASTTRASQQEHAVSVLFPVQGSIIPLGKPLIKGKGVPGTRIVMTLDSQPVLRYETTVRKDGTWVADDAATLAPGRYTLSMHIPDNNGTIRTLDRTFIIAKAGEQVLGETTTKSPNQISTPSGQLTPTRVPVVPVGVTPVVPQPTQTTLVVQGVPPGGMPQWLVWVGAVGLLGGYISIRAGRYSRE